MKILIVSLLKRKITPEITASRPRIIYELSRGLLTKGHQVTILGTGDSHVPGVKIIPLIGKAFVDLPPAENQFYTETAYLVQMAKKIKEIHHDYDLIHNHTYPEFINMLVMENLSTPSLTTVHGQATPEIDQTLSLFQESKIAALSQAHKQKFRKTSIAYVVYNGVDTGLYQFQEKKQDYLLWLGRLSRAKNPDGTFYDPKGIRHAIALAEVTGSKLLLSGNIEDNKFYEHDVKPHLSDQIQWYGPLASEQMIKKEQVAKLMASAKAFLMTVNWEEPFGLVMAEAMSCGTPVIGFDRGSVAELVLNGKTGFVVDPQKGVEGLKEALAKIETVKPEDCRKHVEDNFSIEKMVENYEKIYRRLI